MPEHHESHPPTAELLRDAFGAQAAMLLYTAAKLDLAEHLASGATTADQLAALAGAHPRAVQRILRALVTRGVCEEVAVGQFRLTGLGACLREGHPQSIRARVLLNVEVHHALWADLLQTVKSGESASVRVHGVPFYDHLSRNRAAGEVFDRAMSGAGGMRDRFRAVIDAYDFGRFSRIVDVGGGNGALLVEILKSSPATHGTVFDLARLAAAAAQTISAAGLEERCRFEAGDAFVAVPGAADAYVLSNFLNSWGDGEACSVLRVLHAAMGDDATLLVIDWVMPGPEEAGHDVEKSREAATMDLVMLSAFGAGSGRLRTFNEFRDLLAEAGFAVLARIPTRASVELIEARRE